jgi:hypothetical protein
MICRRKVIASRHKRLQGSRIEHKESHTRQVRFTRDSGSADHIRLAAKQRRKSSHANIDAPGNDGHLSRFALGIRQRALGLTKKYNFISPNDDRERKSSANKQCQ